MILDLYSRRVVGWAVATGYIRSSPSSHCDEPLSLGSRMQAYCIIRIAAISIFQTNNKWNCGEMVLRSHCLAK